MNTSSPQLYKEVTERIVLLIVQFSIELNSEIVVLLMMLKSGVRKGSGTTGP